ncbi:MAG: hypothetical protein NT040_11280 [Bacteroidetes bacterium]|nr:hypothetical protein [Bacteroidota bacterium]
MTRIEKFARWFGGFFEDQQGAASRKAAAGYWGLLMLTYMIYKSVNGTAVDMEMFVMVLSFTGGLYGMMLLERFVKKTPVDDDKQKNAE